MHCTACVNKIQTALSSVEGVYKVDVDLVSKSATITGTAHPDVLIQAVKDVDYESTIFDSPQENPKTETVSQIQELFPLFLIFFYIIVFSIIINRTNFQLDSFMYDFMGLFYIVFSFFKFLDYKNFPSSFSMYDPIAKTFPFYGWMYPFIETILGLLFLLRIQLFISLCVTIAILGITTVGVTRSLMNKSNIQCACLGTALKLPMTKATFIENFIMIIMAVWMIISSNFI
tara:strand:- start:1027 stop:1716 length:690 start_codon:yes stop_codon:yes gene_type:complete